MEHQELSDEQVRHFIEKGYVTIHECFPRDRAKELTDRAFVRLGYRRDDPSTWAEARVHMPSLDRWDIKEFAPRAWAAICDLCGEDRIRQPAMWGDSFIVNFHQGIDTPWTPPSDKSPGWHKDGDFFRHFLDSPEQGLLVIVIWSDIEPQGGGTFFACDSIAPVARFLRNRPEGVLPGEFNFRSLIEGCQDFGEATGRVGDVVLIHPFMLHASSQNHSGIPRFITNPPISLTAPTCFDRPDPADYSPVERVVLNALGAERLDYYPTGSRERVVPERERRQQRMLEEEKARLAAA